MSQPLIRLDSRHKQRGSGKNADESQLDDSQLDAIASNVIINANPWGPFDPRQIEYTLDHDDGHSI